MIRIESAYRYQFRQFARFEDFFKLEGKTAKKAHNRHIRSFELDGRCYYIKNHAGVGWKEILKNLLALRLPVITSRTEWKAIAYLRYLGIPTLTPVAYGIKGLNPASRRSFLITEDLGPNITLDALTRDWPNRPPPRALKQALLSGVARIAGRVHSHGFNHRDFYLCHFLLDLSRGEASYDPATLRLILIDLHRAQVRHITPKRWVIKDVGSLYFSAMAIGLTRRDLLRFMAHYQGTDWRNTLIRDEKFWLAVRTRAESLYQKAHGHPAPRLL
ncbi:MAG: lipopolysaccharide core heptose(I) kinase RfaP [Gammaproteobacteria bacterium]|nr:lipopolysaccharide core heptose(I) kinase RfaP [Gammaproteobacteria bacterium]